MHNALKYCTKVTLQGYIKFTKSVVGVTLEIYLSGYKMNEIEKRTELAVSVSAQFILHFSFLLFNFCSKIIYYHTHRSLVSPESPPASHSTILEAVLNLIDHVGSCCRQGRVCYHVWAV